jgi:hypothetical protein
MCNCKGWDIAFYPNDEITVQEHFCRILDDCRHVDNTLEDAADQVAYEYDKLHDWNCDARNRGIIEMKDSRLDFFLEQARMWKNRTHPSYLYYKNPVDNPEDGDTV